MNRPALRKSHNSNALVLRTNLFANMLVLRTFFCKHACVVDESSCEHGRFRNVYLGTILTFIFDSVFLGAALALGTAMGLASAVVLFIGSFIFGDDSKMEHNIAKRGEQLPSELEDRFRQSNAPTSSKARPQRSWKGKGVVEQAILKSLQREERIRAQSARYRDDGVASNSDEEDDIFDQTDNYFEQSTSPQEERGKQYPRGSYKNPTLNSKGHPLPVGATGKGGWGPRGESSSPISRTSSKDFGGQKGTPTALSHGGTDTGRSTSVRRR